jgi:alkylation response protein AidB-like acyl-CoA dehydrogenase
MILFWCLSIASHERTHTHTHTCCRGWDGVGQVGLLGAFLGGGEHLDCLEEGLPGISDLKEFDYFHELIAHEEMGRLGVPSYVDGIRAGYVIGAAPIWNFGPDWMKKEIGIPVVRGEKRICLAISEPFAGSDVAGLKTTATKSDCGNFYIVNGTKKWITGVCVCVCMCVYGPLSWITRVVCALCVYSYVDI